MLAGVPEARPLTAAECSAIGNELMATPEQRILPEVVRAMASIRRKRIAYVEAHPADFDPVTARQYLRAWVANYEISDELRESLDSNLSPSVSSLFSPDGLWGGDPPAAHFARFNEWVSITDATHEERLRIMTEQSRFGGTVDANGVAHFAEGDAAVILERFGRRQELELLTPAEWLEAERADGQPAGVPRVWVVDTSGHFYAAVSCRVERGSGEADDVLLGFNTTSGNYLQWPMAGLLHGHIFASQPVGDADEGLDGAVTELVSMGFDESAARAALAQACGSLPSAVEALLARP